MKHRIKHVACLFLKALPVRSMLIASFLLGSGMPLRGGIPLPAGWDDAAIDRIKAGQSPHMLLAVMDFEQTEKLQGKVDLRLSEVLTTVLVKTQRFEIVERSKIEEIIKEQKFQVSGMVDEAKAVEVGKMLGAEAVVVGNVTSVSQTKIDKFAYDVMRTEIGVDVRVVNVKTGKILLTESAVGAVENKIITTAGGTIVNGATNDNSGFASAVRLAIENVGKKIADLGTLIGFVVDVSEKKVTIDIGEDQGIKVGSHFTVLRVGDEIIHPVTKKHLGWKKQTLSQIEIVSTERSMAVGKVTDVDENDAGRPGDYVIMNTQEE